MTKNLINFTYDKGNGDISERTVFPVSMPSENMLSIDLSDFDQETREQYKDYLNKVTEDFHKSIAKAGLANRWRNFNPHKIRKETK